MSLTRPSGNIPNARPAAPQAAQAPPPAPATNPVAALLGKPGSSAGTLNMQGGSLVVNAGGASGALPSGGTIGVALAGLRVGNGSGGNHTAACHASISKAARRHHRRPRRAVASSRTRITTRLASLAVWWVRSHPGALCDF